MPKYPSTAAVVIADYEEKNGAPLSDQARELITIMVELENKAYEQGTEDGFLKAFDQAAEKEKGIITEETPEDDAKLQEALMELRAQLESDFESDGFTAALNNLAPVPSGLSWGEKLYCLAKEAFVVGGFYMLWNHIQKEKEEEPVNAGN